MLVVGRFLLQVCRYGFTDIHSFVFFGWVDFATRALEKTTGVEPMSREFGF